MPWTCYSATMLQTRNQNYTMTLYITLSDGQKHTQKTMEMQLITQTVTIIVKINTRKAEL